MIIKVNKTYYNMSLHLNNKGLNHLKSKLIHLRVYLLIIFYITYNLIFYITIFHFFKYIIFK